MGGRGAVSGISRIRPLRPGDAGYGAPTQDGSMRKAIAWHGSSAIFDSFDASFADSRHQNYGNGFCFSSSESKAEMYGGYTYEVEITYSTDLKTSKKTGREKDFQYNPETGYWVIPHSEAANIRIISRKKNRNAPE